MDLEKLKQGLKGKLVTFRRQRFVRSKTREDLVITSRDILTSQLQDSIKKGYVVIIDGVAYETSDRKKWRFLDYEKPSQRREEIKKFSWEIKEGG